VKKRAEAKSETLVDRKKRTFPAKENKVSNIEKVFPLGKGESADSSLM